MTVTATQIIRTDNNQAKLPSVIERLADIPEEEIWRLCTDPYLLLCYSWMKKAPLMLKHAASRT